MEDEDSESQVMENWSVLDELQYRNSTIEDTLTHFNNINTFSDEIEGREDQCHTSCPPEPINKTSDLNSKFVFKGFKKRILAQTQENQNTLQKPVLQEQHSTSKNSKDKKDPKGGRVNEYAQYLGLQPSPNSDQPTPNSALQPAPNLNFKPGHYSNSQPGHYSNSQPAHYSNSQSGHYSNSQPGHYSNSQLGHFSNAQTGHYSNSQLSKNSKLTCLKCHSSGNSISRKSCTCASTMVPSQNMASTSDLPSSQLANKFKIQRKVYLCAACGTYFENWNLFLHMRDVHQRHLCLFCLGLFDHAERLSYHLMKNHNIPETSFTSVEEFYKAFKGSCYLICCSCEKVFTETDNFYNHFCSSPQKVQTSANVCSICRQVDGTHMKTCGLAPGSDSEVSVTLGSPGDNVIYKNKLLVKGASKKNLRLNRVVNAGETLVNHFQAKGVDLEKKGSAKFQKQSQNREVRKEIFNTAIAETEAQNSTRDTVAETIMEVSRYTGESENNENEEKEKPLPEEKPPETEVPPKSPEKEQYDSVTETIMEVSRVCVSEKTSISEEDEVDSAKNTCLNESKNTVSDDSKEEEIKSSNPKNEDDVRLAVSSPLDPHSDTSEVKNPESGAQNDTQVDSPSNSPASSPTRKSLSIPQQHPQATDSPSKPEEKTPEPVQRVCDYQFFNTVTKTDRSLVIKICTNKNSQFSIASRVGNSSENHNPNTESEENNNRESSTSEEKNSDRGRDSPGSFNLNECDSDSDSEKLAVVDSNAEEQGEADGEQGSKMEIDEAKDEEKEENPVEPEAPDEQKPEESDGIVVAGEEIPLIELNIEDIPENMQAQDLLRKCIEAASVFCVYCNHARHIAVNGKQLGLHMLSEHRFQPQHPAVILQTEQVISKMKKSIEELDSHCFNLDSYSTPHGTYHIPIPRIFECFHCRFYSTVHKELYLHNRKMHQKTILVCIMCKSTFFSYSELLCHLCPGAYSPNINVKYRCCLCPVSNLPSAFRLMVHLRKKHHACDVCLESTGNQQRLSNHVWKHKLHHICYRCGISYRNKPDITKHLFWKHGTESILCKKCLQKKWPHVYHFCIPPTAFVCEECSLTFSRAVALKVHKRLHSEDAPHVCEECSERFISQKLLAKHEKKHKEPPVIEEPIPAEEGMIEEEKHEKTEEEQVNDEQMEIVKEVKEDESKKKKVVDLYDLPPLNLSSESDSDSEEEKPKSEEKEEKEESQESKIEESVDKEKCEEQEPKKTEVVEESVEAENIVYVELNEEEKKEEAQIMDGIWDNFKSYAASLGIQESTSSPAKGTDTDIEFLKSVILADHDYCTVTLEHEKSPKANEENYQKARSKSPEAPITITPVKTGYEQEAKKKLKASKKRKRNGSSSSSDSSSDSDSSSCSCGSNCSCSSSSGSSSSSSSSSDSDSSASEGSPKKQHKKKEKKSDVEPEVNQTQENGSFEEIIEPGEPPQPVLRESDLETDESETDEDFYDENPQLLANKLFAEKRNQLILSTAVPPVPTEPAPLNNGTVLDTDSPSIQETNTPSIQVKKKVKTKKRKKSDKGKQKVPIVESIKLNIPRSFYDNRPGFHSSPSVITVQPSRSSTPNFMSQETFDSTPNVAGSGSENENKRSSKRKRIPKRFYGDSSDEENERLMPKWRKMESVLTPNPIPRPQVQPQIQNLATPPPYSGTTLTLKRSNSTFKVETPVASASESEEPAESSCESESEADEGPQIHLPQHLPPNPERVDNLYCYCQCPYDEVSEMIACDGSDCRIEWFHFECVGIMVPPKGKWYCPDCRKRLGIPEDNEDFVYSQ